MHWHCKHFKHTTNSSCGSRNEPCYTRIFTFKYYALIMKSFSISYPSRFTLESTRTNSHDFIWTRIPYTNNFYFLPMRIKTACMRSFVLAFPERVPCNLRVLYSLFYKLRWCRTTRESPREMKPFYTHCDIWIVSDA